MPDPIRQAAENARVVRPEGDLDLHAAPAFLAETKGLLEGGVRRMVVDCVRVRFIDSAGVGALLVTRQQMKKVGGELRLCGLHGPVLSILETFHVRQMFEVYDELSKAVESPPHPA